MDINEYIKRMEAAVSKANVALSDMAKENAALKSRVAQLESQLAKKQGPSHASSSVLSSGIPGMQAAGGGGTMLAKPANVAAASTAQASSELTLEDMDDVFGEDVEEEQPDDRGDDQGLRSSGLGMSDDNSSRQSSSASESTAETGMKSRNAAKSAKKQKTQHVPWGTSLLQPEKPLQDAHHTGLVSTISTISTDGTFASVPVLKQSTARTVSFAELQVSAAAASHGSSSAAASIVSSPSKPAVSAAPTKAKAKKRTVFASFKEGLGSLSPAPDTVDGVADVLFQCCHTHPMLLAACKDIMAKLAGVGQEAAHTFRVISGPVMGTMGDSAAAPALPEHASPLAQSLQLSWNATMNEMRGASSASARVLSCAGPIDAAVLPCVRRLNRHVASLLLPQFGVVQIDCEKDKGAAKPSGTSVVRLMHQVFESIIHRSASSDSDGVALTAAHALADMYKVEHVGQDAAVQLVCQRIMPTISERFFASLRKQKKFNSLFTLMSGESLRGVGARTGSYMQGCDTSRAGAASEVSAHCEEYDSWDVVCWKRWGLANSKHEERCGESAQKPVPSDEAAGEAARVDEPDATNSFDSENDEGHIDRNSGVDSMQGVHDSDEESATGGERKISRILSKGGFWTQVATECVQCYFLLVTCLKLEMFELLCNNIQQILLQNSSRDHSDGKIFVLPGSLMGLSLFFYHHVYPLLLRLHVETPSRTINIRESDDMCSHLSLFLNDAMPNYLCEDDVVDIPENVLLDLIIFAEMTLVICNGDKKNCGDNAISAPAFEGVDDEVLSSTSNSGAKVLQTAASLMLCEVCNHELSAAILKTCCSDASEHSSMQKRYEYLKSVLKYRFEGAWGCFIGESLQCGTASNGNNKELLCALQLNGTNSFAESIVSIMHSVDAMGSGRGGGAAVSIPSVVDDWLSGLMKVEVFREVVSGTTQQIQQQEEEREQLGYPPKRPSVWTVDTIALEHMRTKWLEYFAGCNLAEEGANNRGGGYCAPEQQFHEISSALLKAQALFEAVLLDFYGFEGCRRSGNISGQDGMGDYGNSAVDSSVFNGYSIGWKSGDLGTGQPTGKMLSLRLGAIRVNYKRMSELLYTYCQAMQRDVTHSDAEAIAAMQRFDLNNTAVVLTARQHLLVSLPFLTTTMEIECPEAGMGLNAERSSSSNTIVEVFGLFDDFCGLCNTPNSPLKHVLADVSTNSTTESQQLRASIVELYNKLCHGFRDAVGLAAAGCFESLIYYSTVSARALIKILFTMERHRSSNSEINLVVPSTATSKPARNNRANEILMSVPLFTKMAVEAIRLLICAPLPWGCARSNGAIVSDLMLLANKCTELGKEHLFSQNKGEKMSIMTLLNGSGTALNILPVDILQWLHNVSSTQRIPVLVINLDSRFDRWLKMLRQCDAHGLVAVRIPAKDGRDIAVTTSQDGTSETRTVVRSRFKGLKNSIPVTTHWDSTLNATYDSQCVVNKATQLTPSERGCAWSHYNAWELITKIAEACGIQAGKSSTGVIQNKEQFPNFPINLWAESLVNCSWPIFRYSREKHSEIKEPPPKQRGKRRKTQGDNADSADVTHCTQLCQWDVMDFCQRLGGTNSTGDVVDWFLILEDDAHIFNANAHVLQRQLRHKVIELLPQMPKGWDVMYLGHVIPRSVKSELVSKGASVLATSIRVQQDRLGNVKGSIAWRNNKTVQAQHFQKPAEILEIPYCWQLHSYILRSSSASKLLSQCPIDQPVDNFIAKLMHEGSFNGLAIQPPLLRQVDSVKGSSGNISHFQAGSAAGRTGSGVHSSSNIQHSGKN